MRVFFLLHTLGSSLSLYIKIWHKLCKKLLLDYAQCSMQNWLITFNGMWDVVSKQRWIQILTSCCRLHVLFVTVIELKIRLVDTTSSTNKTGRVEIYHPKFDWGTVCDDFWGDTESDVVCRQLGFTGVSMTRKGAYYGAGSGRILLDDVSCTGNESYIWVCNHLSWNSHNCNHYEDVGVECYW